MKPLSNPWWAIALVVLPHFILAGIELSYFRIIGTSLTDGQARLWAGYTIVLGLMTFSTLLYASFCLLNKRDLNPIFSVVVLFSHILFIYYFTMHENALIPTNTPRWIAVQGDLSLYVYMFMMPAILLGLLGLIHHFTPNPQETSLQNDFIGIVFVPIGIYCAITILPTLDGSKIFQLDFIRHASVVLAVGGLVSFFFFLVRFVYVLAMRKAKNQLETDAKIAIRVLVALAAPLLGIGLNNTTFTQIFGDFSHYSFFALAVVNGIATVLPAVEDKYGRLAIFILRSITFTYIVYFTLIFLPFLPLSVPLILVFGAGILMMMPLVNFILQGRILLTDFEYLQTHWSKNALAGVFVGSLLVLPALYLRHCLSDRYNIHQALAYLYESNLETEAPHINPDKLRQSLAFMRLTKDRRNEGFFDNQHGKQPILSEFYRWVVLDNLTLSDEKINQLSSTFIGEEIAPKNAQNFANNAPQPQNVILDSIWTETNFNKEKGEYSTWLHTKTRNTTQMPNQEFSTEMHLPAGVFVADYYLDIENKREKGILAEKKAVKWIYQQIVSVRRDPGFLELKGKDRLAWRIFPFMDKQVRTSGIQFLHREPLSFSLDTASKKIVINHLTPEGKTPSTPEKETNISVETDFGWYVSASAKASLPLVTRPAMYYFLVDNSKASASYSKYADHIQEIVRRQGIKPEQAQIVLTNYKDEKYALGGNLATILRDRRATGGVLWERAIKRLWLKHQKEAKNQQPIFILLSENKPQLEDWAGEATFWWAGKQASFETLPTHAGEATTTFAQINVPSVRAYTNAKNTLAYLPDDGKASILPTFADLPAQKINEQIHERSWVSGLRLHLAEQTLAYKPTSQAHWLATVQASFRTQIQCKATSFIALENEMQKQALLAKQKETLKAKHYLDTQENEEVRRMDEPVWLWAIVLVLGGLWIVRRQVHLKRT